MKMLENWKVTNKELNEWGIYTVGKQYTVKDWMIEDDRGNETNFWNVRRWFK